MPITHNPIKLARYAMAGWVPGGRRYCVICKHHVWRFMPHGRGAGGAPKLMAALGTVGSDVEHFECPHCGAHDRERHLLMYLETSGTLEAMRGKAVLHFAPEKRLSRLIAQTEPARYVRCDLYPSDPSIEPVDMLDMPFDDETFDFLIANHVLEHVDDDGLALREIHRVLKPGGQAVVQTPYSTKLHRTWQDAGIDTAAARLQAHGQEDHVRLYGMDIFERICGAGFISLVQRHADILGGVDAAKFGVNAKEPFMHFLKN